ncbi:hypothetical protein [Archaeoglobus sp.]
MDVEEALSRALEVASSEKVYSKIEELFNKGEVSRSEFERLIEILRGLE